MSLYLCRMYGDVTYNFKIYLWRKIISQMRYLSLIMCSIIEKVSLQFLLYFDWTVVTKHVTEKFISLLMSNEILKSFFFCNCRKPTIKIQTFRNGINTPQNKVLFTFNFLECFLRWSVFSKCTCRNYFEHLKKAYVLLHQSSSQY